MTTNPCRCCGNCCISNGMIPPLMSDEDAPIWLHTLVRYLRRQFGDVAERYPCVFLNTQNRHCDIYDMRPRKCRMFSCEEKQSNWQIDWPNMAGNTPCVIYDSMGRERAKFLGLEAIAAHIVFLMQENDQLKKEKR